LRASRPAAISTLGLDVLVQLGNGRNHDIAMADGILLAFGLGADVRLVETRF
jgi:hypothetical protein